MNNFKLQLRIHRAARFFCFLLWLIAVAETVVLAAFGSWLFAYPLAASAASHWLMLQMYNHCKWFRYAIATVPIIEVAKSIPFPDCPVRHRNIRYVKQYKVKKY